MYPFCVESLSLHLISIQSGQARDEQKIESKDVTRSRGKHLATQCPYAEYRESNFFGKGRKRPFARNPWLPPRVFGLHLATPERCSIKSLNNWQGRIGATDVQIATHMTWQSFFSSAAGTSQTSLVTPPWRHYILCLIRCMNLWNRTNSNYCDI
jgi:hypothetical protein